jgi:tetratricopeptide (TPR) repeat protein
MSNFSSRREREEMQELLKVYNNLKAGRQITFIEEEDFERIIDYFDDKDDLPSAMDAAELSLRHFPYSAQLMLKKADLLIADRKYAAALTLLEEAALYDSNDINLYILKTDAYLALEEPEKAAALLEDALELFEGDDRLELLFELTDVYDDYEDFEKVFDCLQLILREDPNNEEALLKICFWADFTGRCEESIKLHQWITDEFPYNELAWFNLATAFQGLKLYEKAIDAYQYALVIDEKLDIAYRNMGDAFIRLRRYKEAIENLEKVLELSRPEDVIYEAIGHCYHKLHNYPQARFNYRKASHLNPTDSRIYYKIANTYCNEERWESAIKQLETAMRMQPNQPDYNLLMGECKMKQGKLKEAIQFYSNVVRVRPKNISGRESLIRCLIKAGFMDEAMEQCQHAATATNNNPVFEYYSSAIFFHLGKNKEALLQMEKGLSGNPRGFRKMLDLVPGLLQRANVVDLINKYIKKRRKH